MINDNQHFSSYFDNVLSKGFFPRITLPTRIDPPSATLIDNIFTNDVTDENKSTSGILINAISDHKMIFTHIENDSYVEKIDKYITIETKDETSIQN